MEKTLLNYNKFKENPSLFYSQLPKKAEEELIVFLNYLIFKYDIKDFNDSKLTSNSINKEKKMSKNDFLSFLENDFKLSKQELKNIIESQKEINKWKIIEF